MVEAVTRHSAPLLPSSLGLPSRFKSYRTGQAEAAIALWTSDKRISCLSAPPGSGKSLLHVSVAQLVDEGWRTLYLTATKNLQRQVHAEFDELLKMVMGASNYRCIALDKGGLLEGYGAVGSSCADGPCKAGVRCRLRDGGCLHYDAEARARESRIVLTNYAKWLSMARYSDPMSLGKFDLIVADEAHLVGELLTDFSAVELHAEEVHKLLGERLPALDEGVDTWASWARKTANVARMKVTALRAELKDVPRSMRQPLTKQLLRLSALERDLTEMGSARSWLRTDDASKQVDVPGGVTDWIAYETPKGAKFTPVWAHQYAERYLFRGVGKVVLSSGTLMPSIVKRLGISEQAYDWHEVPSSFDPKRRPVIYVPTTRVDNRMTEGQKRLWMNRIDDIISKRLDKKILIHSVSYARAQEIKARSKWAQHMIVHDSRTTQEAVAQFRKAKAPCVLVSPALVEGVDFPDDDVRVQIVCKVPFASATDPLFKARCKADPNYRFECAALLIVQMSGRGMRSASDACECVSPETRILTADLRWVSAGDTRRGDLLLAVDEKSPVEGIPHPGAAARRCWRWSTVEKSVIRKMPRVRVITETADVICTPNHPWLIFGRKRDGEHTARMLVWRRTDQLEPIHDQLIVASEVWEHDESWPSGWASGFFDGEGCLIVGMGKRNSRCLGLSASQNHGVVADFCETTLKDLGFDFHRLFRPRVGHMTKDAATFRLKGGLQEVLRFMGTVRPVRILDRFLGCPRGEQFKKIGLSRVIAVEKLPPGDICSLQTSTKTYLAEGFVAHNTWVIDDHFDYLRGKVSWPGWYRAAWRQVSSVPEQWTAAA